MGDCIICCANWDPIDSESWLLIRLLGQPLTWVCPQPTSLLGDQRLLDYNLGVLRRHCRILSRELPWPDLHFSGVPPALDCRV